MDNRLHREVGFIKGPRFFEEGGKVLFSYGVDPNNTVGPRPVTQADKLRYATAWDAFYATVRKAAPVEPVPEPVASLEAAPIIKRPRGRPKRPE